jgi:hypothetical protein
MPDLDLFGELHDPSGAVIVDDYREDWEPGRDSCWDCQSVILGDRTPGTRFLHNPDTCPLLGREVCRTSGICSNFKRRPA